jgi:DNA-binding HxlR family transcriptional regulator
MKSGFGQFCPVAVASEVFAQRWTPIILRELLAGAQHFNEIHRGIPLISRPLLARRLRELEAIGAVARQPLPGKRGHSYRLTDAGQEFRPVIEALGTWGQRWSVRFEPHHLDAGLLMWNMRRRIVRERLPQQRVVARFEFSGIPASYRGYRIFWLLLERTQIDLCVEDPGFEVDLYIAADLATMAKVWLGDLAFDSAQRAKTVQVVGPKGLVRPFASWLMLSPFASVPRPGEAAAAGDRSKRQGAELLAPL